VKLVPNLKCHFNSFFALLVYGRESQAASQIIMPKIDFHAFFINVLCEKRMKSR